MLIDTIDMHTYRNQRRYFDQNNLRVYIEKAKGKEKRGRHSIFFREEIRQLHEREYT